MCVNIVVCHCYDVFETQLDAVTLQQNIMYVTSSHNVTLLQKELSLPLAGVLSSRHADACSALVTLHQPGAGARS